MPRNPLLEAIARDLWGSNRKQEVIVDNSGYPVSIVTFPPEVIVNSSGNPVATLTFLSRIKDVPILNLQPDKLTPGPIIEEKPERRLDFSL